MQKQLQTYRRGGEEKISVKYPSPGSVAKFTNIQKHLEQLFIAFEHLEALRVLQDVSNCATGLEEVSTGKLQLNVGVHVYILQLPDFGRDDEAKIREGPLYKIRSISLPESVDDVKVVYHVRLLKDDEEEEEETKKCHASQLLRKLYDCENSG